MSDETANTNDLDASEWARTERIRQSRGEPGDDMSVRRKDEVGHLEPDTMEFIAAQPRRESESIEMQDDDSGERARATFHLWNSLDPFRFKPELTAEEQFDD